MVSAVHFLTQLMALVCCCSASVYRGVTASKHQQGIRQECSFTLVLEQWISSHQKRIVTALRKHSVPRPLRTTESLQMFPLRLIYVLSCFQNFSFVFDSVCICFHQPTDSGFIDDSVVLLLPASLCLMRHNELCRGKKYKYNNHYEIKR